MREVLAIVKVSDDGTPLEIDEMGVCTRQEFEADLIKMQANTQLIDALIRMVTGTVQDMRRDKTDGSLFDVFLGPVYFHYDAIAKYLVAQIEKIQANDGQQKQSYTEKFMAKAKSGAIETAASSFLWAVRPLVMSNIKERVNDLAAFKEVLPVLLESLPRYRAELAELMESLAAAALQTELPLAQREAFYVSLCQVAQTLKQPISPEMQKSIDDLKAQIAK